MQIISVKVLIGVASRSPFKFLVVHYHLPRTGFFTDFQRHNELSLYALRSIFELGHESHNKRQLFR